MAAPLLLLGIGFAPRAAAAGALPPAIKAAEQLVHLFAVLVHLALFHQGQVLRRRWQLRMASHFTGAQLRVQKLPVPDLRCHLLPKLIVHLRHRQPAPRATPGGAMPVAHLLQKRALLPLPSARCPCIVQHGVQAGALHTMQSCECVAQCCER